MKILILFFLFFFSFNAYTQFEDIQCSNKLPLEKEKKIAYAKELYEKSKIKIRLYTTTTKLLAKRYEDCFGAAKNDNKKCHKKNHLRSTIHKNLKKIRILLSLMKPRFRTDNASLSSHYKYKITKKIKHLYPSLPQLDELTQEEISIAEGVFNQQVQSQINQFSMSNDVQRGLKYYIGKNRKINNKRIKNAYSKIRMNHISSLIKNFHLKKHSWLKKKYKELIDEMPLLAYLSSSIPSDYEIAKAYHQIFLNSNLHLKKLNQGKINFFSIFKYPQIIDSVIGENQQLCPTAKDAYERYLRPATISNTNKVILYLGCSVLFKSPFICNFTYTASAAQIFFLTEDQLRHELSYIEKKLQIYKELDSIDQKQLEAKIGLILFPILAIVPSIASQGIRIIKKKLPSEFTFIEKMTLKQKLTHSESSFFTLAIKKETKNGLIRLSPKKYSRFDIINKYFQVPIRKVSMKITGLPYNFTLNNGLIRFQEKIFLNANNRFGNIPIALFNFSTSLLWMSEIYQVSDYLKKEKAKEKIITKLFFSPLYKDIKEDFLVHKDMTKAISMITSYERSLKNYITISKKLQEEGLSPKDKSYYNILFSNQILSDRFSVLFDSANRYNYDYFKSDHFLKDKNWKFNSENLTHILYLKHLKNIILFSIDQGHFFSKKIQWSNNVQTFLDLPQVDQIILKVQEKELSSDTAKFILIKMLEWYFYTLEIESYNITLLNQQDHKPIPLSEVLNQISNLLN